MKKRTLVISDVHGMSMLFKKALEDNNYNPITDQLILLGDYIDRGEDSYGVVQLAKELQQNGAIVLRGNHEQLAIDARKSEDNSRLWEYNGGGNTKISYSLNVGNLDEDIDWFDTLPYYYNTDDYLFVHAGINPFVEDLNSQSERDLIWIREQFYLSLKTYEKTVVFGHTPFGWPVVISNNTIGIDSAAYYRGKLTTMEITESGERRFYVTTMTDTKKVIEDFVDLSDKNSRGRRFL